MSKRQALERLAQLEIELNLWERQYRSTPLWLYGRLPCMNTLAGVTLHWRQHQIHFRGLVRRLVQGFRSIRHRFSGRTDMVVLNERHLSFDHHAGHEFHYIIDALRLPDGSYSLHEYPNYFSTRSCRTEYGNQYHLLDLWVLVKAGFVVAMQPLVRRRITRWFADLRRHFSPQDCRTIFTAISMGYAHLIFDDAMLRILKRLNRSLRTVYTCMGFFTNSVDNSSGIDVIEIQHGIIPPDHVMYVLPINRYTRPFLRSKKMVLWDDKTRQMLVDHGYEQSNVTLLPRSRLKVYLQRNRAAVQRFLQHSRSDDKEVRLLVVSQGDQMTARAISAFLDTLAAGTSDQTITVQTTILLHPNQAKSPFDDWPEVLVEKNRGQLYDLLLAADAVVGTYSTVLGEASDFHNFVISLTDESRNCDYCVQWLIGDYEDKLVDRPREAAGWLLAHLDQMMSRRGPRSDRLARLMKDVEQPNQPDET